jgi:energy-coupling factor transporter ATP-binding protein EcfA2
MIQFPVLTGLDVRDYQLYPGVDGSGLSAEFDPGLTLVLGANGLGKSTLVSMLFRMLTGDADIRGLGARQMGSGQLEVKPLQPGESKTFANRVDDAARQAHASLHFRLGETAVDATRELNSLALVKLVVDGVELESDEEIFQQVVVEAADVDSFLSWILILRYLVFYSEERRSLVWDASAQRRLLPLLFLTPNETRPVDELTREILSLDSTVRNLATALTKQERELKSQEKALSSQPVVETQLEDLIEQRAQAEADLERLQLEAADAIEARARARLDALRADDRLQSVSTQLDELRIREISRAFPTSEESVAYVLAKLMSDEVCLVCGADASDMASELASRVEGHRCALCDAELADEASEDLAPADIATLRVDLESARFSYEDAATDLSKAERHVTNLVTAIAKADQVVAHATAQIDVLERSLPESDKSISKRRDGIAELRATNNVMRARVLEKKKELDELIQIQNQKLSSYKDQIKDAFERHAHGFLLESCSLVWGSKHEQIGQLGSTIPFSVFHVDMTGGSRHQPSRRESEDEVSESQREFIDLAFRMALVSVAGDSGVGSLVMDAPESSLDAVFAPRAAAVLTRFGRADGVSRVVVTSNLVDGQLIPKLAAEAGIASVDDRRVINLFEVAAPTAAITQLRPDYEAALSRVFHAPGERQG